MDAGETQRFLQMLGCQKISVGPRWVRSTCPLYHRHRGGRDRNPSFAVSVSPADESHCRCLACGAHGSLVSLLWCLEAEGRARPELLSYLAAHNQIDVSKIEDSPPSGPQRGFERVAYYPDPNPTPRRESRFIFPDDEPQAEVPESVLRQMVRSLSDADDVLEYLTRTPDGLRGVEGRGLHPETVREWEIGWHARNHRICIPIRDESGKLVAITGRSFGPQAWGPKYLHSEFKRNRVLFGEHRRVAANCTGYLFEGFFQVIYSWQCGYRNVLARMGTHLSPQHAEKLVRWFDRLVIVPDGDAAGRAAADRDALTLRSLEFPGASRISEVVVVEMPKGKDADMLEPEELRAVIGPTNMC